MPNDTGERVVAAVLAFVNAETWNESKETVETWRDYLFTHFADYVLAEMIKKAEGDEDSVSLLEQHRDLLRRCQEDSIDAAFAPLMQKSGSQIDIPPGFENDMRQIAQLTVLQQSDPAATPKIVQVLECVLGRLASDEHHEFRAAVLNRLATAYCDLLTGDREANLKHAIECYQEALQFRTPEAAPFQYVATQNNLGITYRELPTGNRAANLQRAIECYQAALTVCIQEAAPFEYAMTQNNLGVAYSELPTGDRAANLQHAIECYQAALTVYTPEAIPFQYAMTQNNLGIAYCELPMGNRAANLQRAIQCYQAALTVYTPEAAPLEYATTQNNLGNAYSNLPTGDRTVNLQCAIECYQAALRFRTPAAAPFEYAATQNNLGAAYRSLPTGDRVANLQHVIECYQAALTVYSPEVAPLDYAMIQNNLGNSYDDLPTGSRAANLQRAIECYQAALAIYTPEVAPLDYAMTQNNLGGAYCDLPTGDREVNLKHAIECYQAALRFRTPEVAPLEYAATQSNLGTAYCGLLTGDREANLQRAIECYQAALRFRTPEVAPLDYAMTQNNLGAAYGNLPTGDRTANLQRAIECHQAALRFRTPEVAPFEYAATQNNLGVAYANLPTGDREANLQHAIECYQAALAIYTPEVAPLDYAMTQNNLGGAYSKLPTGNRAANLKHAIECYQAALRIQTFAALPADYRRTNCNLGNLYFGERRWSDALEVYRAAIAAGDSLLAASSSEASRRAEVNETAQLYACAAYCLLQSGQPGEALLMQECGKTRLLVQALALGNADLSTLPEDQQQRMRDTRQEIRALEAEMRLPPDTPARRSDWALADLLRQVRADLNSLIETIRQAHPDFMPTGLDLTGILALVPESGALIAPLVTSQGSALFLVPHGTKEVTDEHVVWLHGFNEGHLGQILRGPANDPRWGGWMGAYFEFRERQTRQALEAWQMIIERFSSAIWEALLAPAHARLSTLKVSRVLLMPAGGLQLLPLHAAWRVVDGKQRTLLDDYEVVYAPSAYALDVSHRRAAQRQGKGALVAGINEYADLQVQPLDNAVAEADAVARLLGCKPLLDAAATKAAVIAQAPGQATLHLSCHGYFAWGEPLASGLICHDEPLTLAEIIGSLNLDTVRLVTLSACETGITEVTQSPDEYVGLPAGFLQAGAPAVVSSLWTVDDKSTAQLMERFYHNHLDKGMSLPASLREAQIWLRDEKGYTSAYYWAAFTLTGA